MRNTHHLNSLFSLVFTFLIVPTLWELARTGRKNILMLRKASSGTIKAARKSFQHFRRRRFWWVITEPRCIGWLQNQGPIIAAQSLVNTMQVTIETIWPAKNRLTETYGRSHSLLLRNVIAHANSHASSCIERALSNKMKNDRKDCHCYSFPWI